MSIERERRARLEAAQERIRRAKAALLVAPDVEAELAPLRDEAVRLRAELGTLQPQVAVGAAEAAGREDALARAQRLRWSSVGRRAFTFVGGISGLAIGAAAGLLVFFELADAGRTDLVLLAAALGSAALVAIGWRLGRAS